MRVGRTPARRIRSEPEPNRTESDGCFRMKWISENRAVSMLNFSKHNQTHPGSRLLRCLRGSGSSRCLRPSGLSGMLVIYSAFVISLVLTASSVTAQSSEQTRVRQSSGVSEQPRRTQRPLDAESDRASDSPEPTSLFRESLTPERRSGETKSRVGADVPHTGRDTASGSVRDTASGSVRDTASGSVRLHTNGLVQDDNVVRASFTQADSSTETAASETEADAALPAGDGGKPVAEPFLDLNDQETPAVSRNAETATSDSTESIVRTLSTCIILGCLAILTLLGLRKWQRGRGLLPGAGGRSRVIETLSLGPGRTVSLIEMDGLRALVGADAGGIRTIVMAPRAFSEEMAESQTLESGSMNI